MSLYTLTIDLLAKIGAFEEGMGKAEWIATKRSRQIERTLTRAGNAIGAALGTAATVAVGATAAWTQQSVQLADQVTRLSKLAGTSTTEFQRWAAGARLVGIEQEKLSDMLKDTRERVGEFLRSGGGEMKDFFEKIAPAVGLTAEAFAKLSGPEALQLYVDSLQRAGVTQNEMVAYMEALANDAALLIPLLQNNGKAMREAGDAAEHLGGVIDGQTIESLVKMRRQLWEADQAFAGMKIQVVQGVLPAMEDFTELLSDPDTQQAMKDTATAIVSIAGAAARAAQGIGGLVSEYKSLLAEHGLIPLGDDATVDQLEARLKRINGMIEQIEGGRTVWGSDTLAELRKQAAETEAAIAAAPFRGVTSSVQSTVLDRAAKEEEERRKAAIRAAQAAAAAEANAKAAEAARAKQTESLRRYTLEASMAAAIMDGPLKAAQEGNRQRLAELRAELEAGNISQEAYTTLKRESEEQLRRTTEALLEQQKAPDALLGSMREEIELLGMIGPERELYRRGLEAERAMREEINTANEAGAGIGDEMAEALVRQARGFAAMSVEAQEAARAAEDWRWTITASVDEVADVFTDLFSGQLKSTRDFFTALKDVWKRGWWDIVRMSLQQSFVNPIQRALAGMLQGQGFAGAGQSPGLMQAGMRAFGLGGGPQGSGTGWGVLAGGGVSFPGWTTPGAGVGGWGAPGAMGGGGGFGLGGGVPSMNMLTGEFAGGMPYASTALGLYGLYYGATQRGNGGLSSGLAGLSYGAAGIGLGGAIAGGLGAIGTGTGLAGMGAGAVGGAKAAMGGAASSIGGAAWIPVVGWILAAAAVIDMVSGGKLFGTKYEANKITQDLGIGPDGGMASMTVNEVRQRSLFRGRKWRDRELDPTEEQRMAAQELYEAMERVSRSAASQLGLQTVDIVAGSIRQVYNKKGELQSEMSTVLGQTFEESFEDFASRLTSEQLIAAVGQIDSAASKIAQDWRHSAEVLAAGAEFFMTAASDARNGLDLWSGIGLRGLTDFVERMQMGEESLAQAYQRLAGLAGDYGSFMADINTTLMTDGLNSYQQQALQIERTYRQQVKSANDYAKALGLSGARAEDLAKIEELRAVNMGKLRAQMEAENDAFLGQLALSDLSTLRDDQKLTEAMEQFADAVAGGDTQAAQAAAQAALGFGRSLYASGRDYQALYDQVTGQLRGMQPGEGDLDMGDLADELEAMQEGISRAVFELAAQSRRVEAGTDRTNGLLGEIVERLDRIDRNTGGQLEHSRSRDLDDRLNGRRAVMAR